MVGVRRTEEHGDHGVNAVDRPKLLDHLGYEMVKPHTDYAIKNQLALGGSMQCFQTLKSRQIDFNYPYTGGTYATITPKHDTIPKNLKDRIPWRLISFSNEEVERAYGCSPSGWRTT
ncbi:hypothetical protein DMJ13_21065 [halophilic archaeon]|nr:hypothetical protein DMJ13_21065 [halophilic archaeon]